MICVWPFTYQKRPFTFMNKSARVKIEFEVFITQDEEHRKKISPIKYATKFFKQWQYDTMFSHLHVIPWIFKIKKIRNIGG